MNKIKLDKEEKRVLGDFEKGKLKQVKSERKEKERYR